MVDPTDGIHPCLFHMRQCSLMHVRRLRISSVLHASPRAGTLYPRPLAVGHMMWHSGLEPYLRQQLIVF